MAMASTTSRPMAARVYSHRLVAGWYLLRPKILVKPVRPLEPEVSLRLPISSRTKITAVAWVRMAKNGPRMRRLNTSRPSRPATSIGTRTAAAAANQKLWNGCHSSGSSV